MDAALEARIAKLEKALSLESKSAQQEHSSAEKTFALEDKAARQAYRITHLLRALDAKDQEIKALKQQLETTKH